MYNKNKLLNDKQNKKVYCRFVKKCSWRWYYRNTYLMTNKKKVRVYNKPLNHINHQIIYYQFVKKNKLGCIKYSITSSINSRYCLMNIAQICTTNTPITAVYSPAYRKILFLFLLTSNVEINGIYRLSG